MKTKMKMFVSNTVVAIVGGNKMEKNGHLVYVHRLIKYVNANLGVDIRPHQDKAFPKIL